MLKFMLRTPSSSLFRSISPTFRVVGRLAGTKAISNVSVSLGGQTKKSRLVEKICRGHKAWAGEEPTVDDIKRLFEQHPKTKIVTCRKEKANFINELALQALHQHLLVFYKFYQLQPNLRGS